jgi:hypothetical protein
MGLIMLAIIGVVTSFVSNPMGFLKSILMLVIIGSVIFFLARRFLFGASPQNREQNAFRKAAKRSKKRFQQTARKPTSKTNNGNVSTLRKVKHKSKSAAHLTVIEGKKGKKKKRASF